MFPILQPALVALTMVIAVACALKLFDMNSDFAPILRKICKKGEGVGALARQPLPYTHCH